MRKAIFLVVVAALFLAVPAISFSEEQVQEQAPAMPEKGMMEKGMMGQGMMTPEKMKEMRPMHEMMMKKMMQKEIVATTDGGVVIMVGNKLLKYDKNLNLKSEAEIKIDIEAMKESMQQMKQGCPGCKCKEMMQQGAQEAGASVSNKEQ